MIIKIPFQWLPTENSWTWDRTAQYTKSKRCLVCGGLVLYIVQDFCLSPYPHINILAENWGKANECTHLDLPTKTAATETMYSVTCNNVIHAHFKLLVAYLLSFHIAVK